MSFTMRHGDIILTEDARDGFSGYAFEAGSEWRIAHHFWPADGATDDRSSYNFYQQWATHKPVGSIQALSDCRYSIDSAWNVPAFAHE
jgi:hypothetical protein